MHPFFFDSRSGPLFAVFWPAADHGITKTILHVPAFAEEMNKSRRMVTLQAKNLADQGYAVLVLDFFGTGDSYGDFGEATWSIWLENIFDAIVWLQQRGCQSVTLWGLRLGALLAIDFVNQQPNLADNLLVWQPVLNGETFVTQFLRLRVASAMMNNSMPKETTSELKKQILNGRALEVAGYQLHPDLIKPILDLKADSLILQGLKNIGIFDWVASPENQSSLASNRLLNTLLNNKLNAELVTFSGDSFWVSQEITTAPQLLELTSEMVGKWL